MLFATKRTRATALPSVPGLEDVGHGALQKE